jgi:predicted ATP-dependent serine protease
MTVVESCKKCGGVADKLPLAALCNQCADGWLDATRLATDESERVAERARLTLEWADTITPELIEWLWTGRLPLHDLVVLAGEPGLGKSTMTTELAARITRGELDGELHGEPRSVRSRRQRTISPRSSWVA